MAGRGTDIKLGEGIRELGGLMVIGTERHESRRIDNQLRGRAGRQGDPGSSLFFVSMEDPLMLKFGSDRIKSVMMSLGIQENQAIQNKIISKNIESAQKRVEGFNFDRRKALLDYDNVISKQREIVYERRNEILNQVSIRDRIITTFEEYISYQVKSHTTDGKFSSNDLDNIMEHFNANLLKSKKIKIDEIKDKSELEIMTYIKDIVSEDYKNKLKDIPEEIQNDFEKAITLRILDKNWIDQLDAMENLKEGVGLRSYAQTNPLQVYALEGFNMFDEMLASTNAETTQFLLKAEVRQKGKVHFLEFQNGKAVGDIKVIGDTTQTGTTIRFLPDPTIFKTTTEFSYQTIVNRCRQQAYLTKGVMITILDEREATETPKVEKVETDDEYLEDEEDHTGRAGGDDEEDAIIRILGHQSYSFYFEGGIASYVRHLNKNRESYNEPPIIY
jgi:preprotein translocase subunit SecA